MGTQVTLPAACLSSNECVGYLEGSDEGRPAQTVQQHLDECDRCRVLVTELARAILAGGAPSGPATVRTLADGDKLGGRYEIRRFIARGGMGEVYEAFDLVLGDAIALKTLSPTTLDQSDAKVRLIAEVRLARRVMHPHVCRILEFGLHRRGESAEVIPFITMELLDGETLASRLRRDGPLETDAALRLLKELTAGLRAVHQAGVVHRDFKTENVFLVRGKDDADRERAVVMDFGLARALEINRGSGGSSVRGLIGTVAYMAPEQVEGRPPTPAFDVYALGIVAFEMLTGRLPFLGDSPMAVATLRLREEAPLPSSLRRGLPPAWDVFIGRCLSREPSARLAGMDEVLEALDGLASGAPLPPPLPSSASSLARPRRVSRTKVAGAAGALGLALAVIVALGFSGSASRRVVLPVAPVAPLVPAASRAPVHDPNVNPVAASRPTAEVLTLPVLVPQPARAVRKRRVVTRTAEPARPPVEVREIPRGVEEGADDLANPFAPSVPNAR